MERGEATCGSVHQIGALRGCGDDGRWRCSTRVVWCCDNQGFPSTLSVQSRSSHDRGFDKVLNVGFVTVTPIKAGM